MNASPILEVSLGLLILMFIIQWGFAILDYAKVKELISRLIIALEVKQEETNI